MGLRPRRGTAQRPSLEQATVGGRGHRHPECASGREAGGGDHPDRTGPADGGRGLHSLAGCARALGRQEPQPVAGARGVAGGVREVCRTGMRRGAPSLSATSISVFRDGRSRRRCMRRCCMRSRVSASRLPGTWRVRRAGRSITSHIRRTWRRPAASGCGPREDRHDNRLSGHFGVWGDFALVTAGRQLARWA